MFNSLKKIFHRPEQTSPAKLAVEAVDKSSSQSSESELHVKRGNEFLAREELQAAEECYRKAISLSPGAAGPHVCLGFVLMEQKHFAEARTSLETALHIDPRLADAYYMLGVISRDQDNLGEVVENFKKALEINPAMERVYAELCDTYIQLKQFENARNVIESGISLFQNQAVFHYSLGNLYSIENENDKAIHCFKRALSIHSEFPEAHFKLADALFAQGLSEEAVTSYRQALLLKPDLVEAYYGLGIAFQTQGKLDVALQNYNKAIAIKPDYANAYNNLGAVFQAQEKLDAAIENYKKAIAISPEFAAAYNNLGYAFEGQGKLELAVENCRKALSFKPDFADAHNNLGNALQAQGKLDLAAESYRRALSIKPDFAAAYLNLGNAQRKAGKPEAAVDNYHKAISIKPDFAEANRNLGVALRDLGQMDKAEASFRRALEIEPHSFEYALQFHLLLPNLHESLESIIYWRERFQKGIALLMEGTGYVKEARRTLLAPAFDLAYHNQDDRPVMEALCQLFRTKIPEITASAPHVSDWRSPILSGRRVRIGFLSALFLPQHTIGKLYKGLIRHLDRRRFEVMLIHSEESMQDSLRQELDSLADKSFTMPVGVAAQQEAISAERLDVLFYPDIGMSHTTYSLAYARLAPVQAVSWGHPDTTGLDSIDYFVSAASIEPE
ncbi:MAG: tetratricopeptide repeat protein, partial [Burkholderiales bacterium]